MKMAKTTEPHQHYYKYLLSVSEKVKQQNMESLSSDIRQKKGKEPETKKTENVLVLCESESWEKIDQNQEV